MQVGVEQIAAGLNRRPDGLWPILETVSNDVSWLEFNNGAWQFTSAEFQRVRHEQLADELEAESLQGTGDESLVITADEIRAEAEQIAKRRSSTVNPASLLA